MQIIHLNSVSHLFSVLLTLYFIYINTVHACFQIHLNFLPVGHTHEDIDAFFGFFSKYLAQTDVYTIEGTCKRQMF